MKPPLIWVGGKRRNLPHYASYFPAEFGMYWEPFAGGLATFFHLLPPQATLSDSNGHLMQFYRALRADPDGVIHHWEAHYAQHSPAYYKQVRAIEPAYLPAAAQAGWFLYLLRCGYNGLWRVNQQGRFNGPPGNPRYVAPEDLRAAAVALRRANLITSDWRDVTGIGPKAGDLIYLDPPYAPISATANFTGYTRDGWTATDDTLLRQRVGELTQRGVRVMLASSDVAHIRALYAQPPFTVITLQTKRLIAPRSADRTVVNELLILNYDEAVYGDRHQHAIRDSAGVAAPRRAASRGRASRADRAGVSGAGAGA